MGCEAGFEAPLDVRPLSIAAERDAGKPVSSLAELPNQFVAVAIGQTKIANQQITLISVGQF